MSKKMILMATSVLFFSSLEKAKAYNHQLLELNADQVCVGIRHHFAPSFKEVQENLDFLDDEKDKEIINTYKNINVFSYHLDEIKNIKNKEFQQFYLLSQKIYDNHDEIDPLTQTAAQMMFERVLQKYQESKKFWKERKNLLPTYSTSQPINTPKKKKNSLADPYASNNGNANASSTEVSNISVFAKFKIEHKNEVKSH